MIREARTPGLWVSPGAVSPREVSVSGWAPEGTVTDGLGAVKGYIAGVTIIDVTFYFFLLVSRPFFFYSFLFSQKREGVAVGAKIGGMPLRTHKRPASSRPTRPWARWARRPGGCA